MKHALHHLPLPATANWCWAEKEHPNQTILFRTEIKNLSEFESLALHIAAQTRYYLWANGKYIGQGPCPTPWPDNTVDGHAIQADSEGRLTLAVIVYHYGVPTQSHPFAPPALWTRLIGERAGQWQAIDIAPNQWRYLAQGGWQHTKLRRTWATSWMEQFDASQHPTGWEQPGFDDTAWQNAIPVERPGTTLTPRMTPALREHSAPAQKLIAAAKVSVDAPIAEEGEGQLSKLLDEEPWELIPHADLQAQWSEGTGITASPEQGGLALLFDLGEEMVGQTEFTIEAASGIVDHYGAELLRDGRPWCFRSNAEYATRFFASQNCSEFRTLNYNGFRYLLIVLRPDKQPIHLKTFGVWRRESDIQPAVNFQSDDPKLQRLWDVSLRTIQVSTQDTSVDCPTREQALFIADGLWNALWLTKLYNEPSFFEHLLDVAGKTQCDNGLMPSAVFSSLNPPHFLLDFCLIYVWSVDVFRRAQPDRLDVVRKALPIFEKTLMWYQNEMAESGIVEADPVAIENYDGGRFQITFIDHPGLWHPFSHPGFERSRSQLGLNAFLAIALDAFYASAAAVDYKHNLDTNILDSDRLRSRCHELFYNPETEYFADCLHDEKRTLVGWSAQSQILAILSGIVSGDDARGLMQRLIRDRKDPGICQCTPYFWVYFAEALMITGFEDQVMPLIQDAWSGMSDDPATTTWWETFEGSPQDTRCHPWAALPAWFLTPEGYNFRLCGESQPAQN
ncbi:alpha-L-rhamnosidase N-terminal domain-containing protein [Cerasicoccus fimbriatus]|uniref:alpha-L-rhamnosidase-related protein n=1 Tax=Cerasicoccus fimbriatus TaxID=3014554 RepID=UPI0022B33CB9|nr:alpha-L-rhamnosidase N-terminal domain-containing protein [Cerasicoccus sp. TK19100]